VSERKAAIISFGALRGFGLLVQVVSILRSADGSWMHLAVSVIAFLLLALIGPKILAMLLFAGPALAGGEPSPVEPPSGGIFTAADSTTRFDSSGNPMVCADHSILERPRSGHLTSPRERGCRHSDCMLLIRALETDICRVAVVGIDLEQPPCFGCRLRAGSRSVVRLFPLLRFLR
jgi:hypothetical protein